MEKLEGKIAVVTDGNSRRRLRYSTAVRRRWCSHSYHGDRWQSEFDAAVEMIGKNGTGVQRDISNLANLDRLYAECETAKRDIQST